MKGWLRVPTDRVLRAILALGAVALGLCAVQSEARAEDDVLDRAPVMRRYVEHRAGRSEIAAQFGTTFGDPYERNLLPGLRFDYHLKDWLTIGADLAVGVPVQTGMAKGIETKLSKPDNPYILSASNLKYLGTAHVGVAPLVGKFVAFGALPLAFDVHVNLAIGMAGIGGDAVVTSSSTSLAPSVSAGVRLFLTHVVALNLDVGELFVKRSLAVNRDSKALGAAYGGNTVATFGVSFFLPADARRAD